MVDPERDGFLVELTLVKSLGRGGGKKGKCGNPGKTAWEKMAKKKRFVVRIQNKDDLCCARAIVTMKEKVDKRSHYQNLRRGRPIQQRWASATSRSGCSRRPLRVQGIAKIPRLPWTTWIPTYRG